MKMTRILLAFIGAAMFATSCSNEGDDFGSQGIANTKQMTFNATQDGDVTSRAVIASDGKKINWQSTDKIAVFDDKDASAVEFSVTPKEDATSATISGTVAADASKYLAVYPSTVGSAEGVTKDIANKKVSGITIPYQQNATAGTFDPAAGIMVAYTDNTTMSFKNVCSYIKVTTDQAYKQIQVIADAQIAGVYDVTVGDDAATVTNSTGSTNPGAIKNVVELNGTIAANTTYYIAIAPTTLWSLRVVAYTNDDHTTGKEMTATVSATTGKKIAANKVVDLGTISTKWKQSVDTHRGSCDGHSWIQLWADGPKFAEMNIGAKCVLYWGSLMTWEDATLPDANYKWGANWRTPGYPSESGLASKYQMDLLNTSNVNKEHTAQGFAYGWKFTPANGSSFSGSLFLPAYYNSADGYAFYWSSTAYDAGKARGLYLSASDDNCRWNSLGLSNRFLVRPVLR